jgi:putative ABC transport system ATP-binding protein
LKIQLQDVLPEGIPTKRDIHSIWERKIELDLNETYLVRGASGRGKSTFLHMLLGIRRNYSGQVLLGEEDIGSFCSEKWARIRQDTLAMVFQDLRLLGELTAWENLSIKTRLAESPQSKQIEELAERLGIKEQLEQPCHLLSFGQQQRLAILRALLQPFRALLLDEPFSHLDPDNSRICLDLILEICVERDAGLFLATLDDDYGLNPDQELRV